MNKPEMTTMFVVAMSDCFKDVEKRELEGMPKIDIDEDATEIFQAALHAMMVFYKMVTSDTEIDIIGFTHLLNRLAIQEIKSEDFYE